MLTPVKEYSTLSLIHICFLVRLGYDEAVTTMSREEMYRTIHPDDIKEIRVLFDKALSGEEESTRLNFRQRNVKGEYEWWEYLSLIHIYLSEIQKEESLQTSYCICGEGR